MNLRVIILFILLLSGFCVNAQEYVSLNGEWQFALAKTEQEAKRLEDFSSPGFSSQKFKKYLYRPIGLFWDMRNLYIEGSRKTRLVRAFIYINSRLLKAGMGSVYCFISAGCGHRQKSG